MNSLTAPDLADGENALGIDAVGRTSAEITTPVDLLYESERILVRRRPGSADLRERTCQADVFDLRSELQELRRILARDELPAITIHRARPRDGISFSAAADSCLASFDVALGAEENFVVLDIEGEWVMDGPEAHIEEAAAQLRARLDAFNWNAPHRCVPSLCYIADEHPSSVQLEVTTICNLHCGYCNNRLLEAKSHTSLGEILRILDQIDFKKVRHMDLTGLGESLLHPGLPAIVAEIRRRGHGFSISLVTNGTTSTVDRCRPLLEAGLGGIAVSLDSLDPVRFHASRAGARLDTVRKNVIELARFRKANPNLPFQLNLKPVLLEQDPYEETDRLLEFSAEHGLDQPRFSMLDPRPSAAMHYGPALPVRKWTTETRDAFSSWVEERWAKLTGILTGDETSLTKHSLPWIHPQLRDDLDVCEWVIDTAYVGGDGFCIPCCEQMGDQPRQRLASVFEKPLARLWNDELLYAYRLPLSLGLVPPNCQNCTFAPKKGKPLVLPLP